MERLESIRRVVGGCEVELVYRTEAAWVLPPVPAADLAAFFDESAVPWEGPADRPHGYVFGYPVTYPRWRNYYAVGRVH